MHSIRFLLLVIGKKLEIYDHQRARNPVFYAPAAGLAQGERNIADDDVGRVENLEYGESHELRSGAKSRGCGGEAGQTECVPCVSLLRARAPCCFASCGAPPRWNYEMSWGSHEGRFFVCFVARAAGDALKEAIKRQVEFYFSRGNLTNDAFLVSQMNHQMYAFGALVTTHHSSQSLMFVCVCFHLGTCPSR